MVIFNIFFTVILILAAFLYSYFVIDRFNFYFWIFIAFDFIFAFIGYNIACMLFGVGYFWFYICIALSLVAICIGTISFKNLCIYRDLYYQGLKEQEKAELDENAYYQQAKQDVDSIIKNNKEN
jgi:hypothetical protein